MLGGSIDYLFSAESKRSLATVSQKPVRERWFVLYLILSRFRDAVCLVSQSTLLCNDKYIAHDGGGPNPSRKILVLPNSDPRHPPFGKPSHHPQSFES